VNEESVRHKKTIPFITLPIYLIW